MEKKTESRPPVKDEILKTIFNKLPQGVYWCDTSLNFLGANQTFLNDFGIQGPEAIYGQNMLVIDAFQNNKPLFSQNKNALELDEGSQTVSYQLVPKTGDSFWVEHSVQPLFNQAGNKIGLLGSYTDISEARKATEEMALAKEAAEQANESKSEFLANMSHEIRTPLNAIIGMANLALKTELTDKQSNYLRAINSSSKTLLGVINDVLDFSKIEANKLTIEKVPFDLNETFATIADMFAYKAYDKDLEFIINVPANIPTQVVGDPMRLSQVLINLVSNAIKFTEEGEINISCTLLEQTQEQILIRISVTDTGIGLSEEQRTHLFQAFSQADSSTTRKFGGTGLGLTISRRLISLMQGDMGMTSSLGQGSTFYIELALHLQSEQDHTHHELLVEKLRGIRVLAVDDNLSTREMLYEMLQSYNMDVKVSRSGEQALKLIQQAAQTEQPYQVVLVDWRLPGIDGLGLVEKVQQTIPTEIRPEMILATGYYAEELAEKAKLVGARNFITKPYTAHTLIRVISSAVFKTTHTAPKKQHKSTHLNISDSLQHAPLLLVEDNEINQHVAKEILQSYGFQVDIAENGQEALTFVQQKNYALVLMDIQMPIMDGYQAAEAIRQLYSFQKLPIVAMTANTMTEDIERALASGMQGHVAKPIDETYLIKQINKWARPGPYETHTSQSTLAEPPQTKTTARRYLQIRGIDFEAALSRLNHNTELYIKLVAQLVSQYRQSALTVSEFISKGKYEEAKRYFHTLKGASANLGLDNLYKRAEVLEKAVQASNIGDVADQIIGLEGLLDQAEQAVHDLALYIKNDSQEMEPSS